MNEEQLKAYKAAYMRRWNAEDPSKRRRLRQAAKARRDEDPELAAKHRENRRLSAARCRANNPQQRLKDALRSRVRVAIHGYGVGKRKAGSAVRDLGCSLGELRIHIEKQFQEGMSWDNYGEWHIDHKKALAHFDLTDREQLLEACHYENLQPLWAGDNRQKGKN